MIRRAGVVLTALAAFTGLTGFQAPERYAVGQVWEYRTRPGDEGSLLKIQRIEAFGPPERGEHVYHISVIGFRLRNGGTVLEHSPVSQETLDASATRPGNQTVEFPDPANGILDWKAHNGGVFTITVAEIIELIDRQTSGR
ncbi:hypothetical protein [Brevundimonas sp. FT23042]|uniref:hypothetical protein n=1 Tax=Brevundimonas sp. FT23042 TaxID=3393749 RepID=UPI003B589846